MAGPIRVAVIGATGFTGEELLRLISQHKRIRLTYVSAKASRSEKIQEIFPELQGRVDLPCNSLDVKEALDKADVFFLSLPHTASMEVLPFLVEKGKKVIDLSADYRLRNVEIFEKYYAKAHSDAKHLKRAIYGLPELYRDSIRRATIIANPGCYPTSILGGLLPFLKGEISWQGTAMIDSKSGVTGAGRRATEAIQKADGRDNFKAYKVTRHQHQPEVEQIMRDKGLTNSSFVFVPHLLPLDRGILTTIYLKLQKPLSAEKLHRIYEASFQEEPFMDLCAPGTFPELKEVKRKNACRVGVTIDSATGTAVIVSAIDNLMKGAAGQAVQNMNLMSGFSEAEGLS